MAANFATAVIFSGSLTSMAAPASEKYVALVGMVALLTAGILVSGVGLQTRISRPTSSHTPCWSAFLPVSGFRLVLRCWAICSASAVHSRKTLVQGLEVLQGLPQANAATAVLSALVACSVLIGNRIFPRIPLSLVAVVGTITASALFHFAEGDSRHRPGAGWAAVAGVTRRDLDRSAGPCAGRSFMFRDDNCPKCRDRGGLRAALS